MISMRNLAAVFEARGCADNVKQLEQKITSAVEVISGHSYSANALDLEWLHSLTLY